MVTGYGIQIILFIMPVMDYQIVLAMHGVDFGKSAEELRKHGHYYRSVMRGNGGGMMMDMNVDSRLNSVRFAATPVVIIAD